MEFTQIKVSFNDNPKRLNRVIAINGDPDLYELGYIIGKSVNAWFEHCYLFETKKPRKSYVFDSWATGDFEWDVPLSEYHLSDLPDTFTYEYDTGERYLFDCKKLKRKITGDYDEDIIAFVVKGIGQGIFENDRGTLSLYLMGRIDPNSSEEGERPWQFLPMNMSFDTYGDFDKPLDLDDYIYYFPEVCSTAKYFKDGDKNNF